MSMIIMRARDEEETPTKMMTTLSEIKRFKTTTEKKLMILKAIKLAPTTSTTRNMKIPMKMMMMICLMMIS